MFEGWEVYPPAPVILRAVYCGEPERQGPNASEQAALQMAASGVGVKSFDTLPLPVQAALTEAKKKADEVQAQKAKRRSNG